MIMNSIVPYDTIFVMIDLCVDARMAFCSGIGTYIRNVVPRLRGVSVTLLVDRLGCEWAQGFEQILFSAPIYSVQEQLLYPLKIPKCDLFWSPHYNVPLLPIRARKRVASIHDACHLAFGSILKKTYARIVMRKALHDSDRVITLSQFSSSEIQRYCGEGSLEIIPVASNSFAKQGASDSLRRKYQLPKRFVLFVGNRKPHKNVEALVRAFSRVKVPDLGLVLVGQGQPLGQVTDVELAALYSMAEMFVFPSLYEGFGLPPIEAMSCGCPTVVARAASIPEVCGDASVYFDPRKVDEMAEKIVQVATNDQLKQELIRKGFERVKLFSWEKTALRHSQVFAEACHA